MQDWVIFTAYFSPVVLVPTLYFVVGGLIGKTYEELCDLPIGNPPGWMFCLVLWPISIPLLIIIGVCMLMAEAITYPARRNSELKKREGIVKKRLDPDYHHERIRLHRAGITDERILLLNNLPWREAEAYLKKKGVL